MIDFLRTADHSLFIFFNSTIANPFFDLIMPVITNQKIWGIPLVIAWLGLIIWGGKRGRIAAFLILISVGLTDFFCAQILKPTIGRMRPSHVFEPLRLLVGKGGKYGFPSNHAANITAGMTVLSFYFRKYWIWFVSAAGLVSFSRIYVGVHYPLDVLAGIFIGFGFALIFITLYLLIKNHFDKAQIHNEKLQD